MLGGAPPVASLPGEIAVTHNEWYDYAAKYEEGEMDLHVPARITDAQAARAQELAVRAFVATECEGMARVDMFVRDDGEVLVNELNTIPGFTVDERLRQAVRRVGHRVRRTARAADRPRARAPRAPPRPALLGHVAADLGPRVTSFTCACCDAGAEVRDPDDGSSARLCPPCRGRRSCSRRRSASSETSVGTWARSAASPAWIVAAKPGVVRSTTVELRAA